MNFSLRVIGFFSLAFGFCFAAKVDQRHAFIHRQKKAKAIQYFDLGSWQSWNFKDRKNEKIDKRALDIYLRSFSRNLLDQHISTIVLSFAQVCDMEQFCRGDYKKLNDRNVIGMLEKNVKGFGIANRPLFEYVVSFLKDRGLEVGLSFGGGVAQEKDWMFDFKKTKPKVLAEKLSCWAKKIGISFLDFDVENRFFMNNDPKLLQSFFIALKKEFFGEVTLTTFGYISSWGVLGEVFCSLFQGVPFQEMFSALNLMLYDKEVYYLNAGQKPLKKWDLCFWLKQLKSNMNASYQQIARCINIGFNARLNYLSPKSSYGPLPYTKMPKGLSNGQAASFIYHCLEKTLTKITLEDIEFGAPFFWTGSADYRVSKDLGFKSQFSTSSHNFVKDFLLYSN